MAIRIGDLKVGDKIIVTAFEATVELPISGVVNLTKVKDINGDVHYVYCTKLTQPVPYSDGAVYVTRYGVFYRYRAADDGISRGTWLPLNDALDETGSGDDLEAFSYPARPLRKVTVSSEELND